MMSIFRLTHLTAEQIQLDWLRLAHAGLVHRLFILLRASLHARCSPTERAPLTLTLIPGETHPDAQDPAAAARTLPGSVWPPSNMFPAWRRGKRTGGSTTRTMVTAQQPGQVRKVRVSCWILLSATCIFSAQAQGKMQQLEVFFFFVHKMYCWMLPEDAQEKSLWMGCQCNVWLKIYMGVQQK